MNLYSKLCLNVIFLIVIFFMLVVNFFFLLVLTSGSGDSGEHTWCTIPAAALPECPGTADYAQQPHPSDSHWHEHHTHTAQHTQPAQPATPGTLHSP